MKSKSLLLFALVSAALLPAARADLDIDIRLGRATPPPPPEVVVVERVGPEAPPPWANPRAQVTYNYYYYPEADVYFRSDTRTWFYRDGSHWRTTRELPRGIRVDFGHSVALRLDSDRPYTYHDRVVAYYPRNYFTRVRYKDRDNHWHGAPERGPDHDRHDDKGHRDDHDRDRH